MKSLVQKIEIQNFKAFREFSLDLEGRHLLLYGANGSGKSSLYWAIYTFLQSAGKPEHSIAKYFIKEGDESLLNIHEDATAKPGLIATTLRDTSTNNDTTYHISEIDHGTYNKPIILKGDLASDFINYRFFFGFSHFRNSQKFDLWPLFEKEILPFCIKRNDEIPINLWNEIDSRSEEPNPEGKTGRAGTILYEQYQTKTAKFSSILKEAIDSISAEAQKFYNEHFAEDDPAPVSFKIGVTVPPKVGGSNRRNYKFTKPKIEFAIKIGERIIPRPQSFLNEAKMTQMALSIRFAASLVNLHESDLKLLVLDDLLVSLDMSNREKVVKILLSETFDDYQKIILTHDYGFFQEFRRTVAGDHTDWCFLLLEGTSSTTIGYRTVKTDMQKAQEYISGHNLDEAALCLRKVAENTAKRFTNRNNAVDPTKGFVGLTASLRAAKEKVLNELPRSLYKKVLEGTPDGYHRYLIPANDADLDVCSELDNPTRGKLKSQRKRLRKLLSEEHLDQLRRVKLIEDVLACTERVLNPGAHSGTQPLYLQEVQEALRLIQQLQDALPVEEAI